MSRIGKKTITVPSNVNLILEEKTLKIKGPLGELEIVLPKFVDLDFSLPTLSVNIQNPMDRQERSSWGTIRSLIANAILGVSEGFTKELQLNGVGYKMELGKDLILYIGFSHPVVISVPKDVTLNLTKNTLSGKSYDKQLLGNFFANIHNLKPCDPYKQKGFKYPGRFYIKKEGKKKSK